MTYEPNMKTKLPTWLNGQTIAILTVVVAVGAMTQTGFSSLRVDVRADIDRLEAGQEALRTEMLTRMDQLETDLRTEFKADIGELREDLRGLDVRLRSVETRLGAVEIQLGNMETRLTKVEGRLTTVENRLTKVETRLTAMDDRLGTVESRLDTVEGRLDAMDTRLASIEAVLPFVGRAIAEARPQLFEEGAAGEGDS